MSWLNRLFKRQPAVEPIPVQAAPGEIHAAMANAFLSDWARERQQERRWRWIKRLSFVAAGLVFGVLYVVGAMTLAGKKIVPKEPLVAVVRIEGPIMHEGVGSAEEVVPALKKAFERENVRAVVLSIDSGGGQPLEAERINAAIKQLRAKHNKPLIAVINNVGASAAYMIGMHSDKVVAGRYSMVGSIGAIMHAWDFHKLTNKLEIEQRVYASGKLKNMLNQFTPPTPEGDAKAQDMIQAVGGEFAAELRRARGNKLKAGVDFATGEVWSGSQAQVIGLVDEIGTVETVVAQFEGAKAFDFGPNESRGPFALFGKAQIQQLFARLSEPRLY